MYTINFKAATKIISEKKDMLNQPIKEEKNRIKKKKLIQKKAEKREQKTDGTNRKEKSYMLCLKQTIGITLYIVQTP